MGEEKPRGINIITKIWIIASYSIFSFALFAVVVSFLYYQNTKSIVYKDIKNTVSSIHHHLAYLYADDTLFYKNPSFKLYLRNLDLSTKHNIYIANQNGIITSIDQNGHNNLYKNFIDNIPYNSKYGQIEYNQDGINYIVNYRNIGQNDMYFYYEVNKDDLLSPFIDNLKKLFILLFIMSFVILVITGIMTSSIKNSIKALYKNIKRFLRSRNVSQINIGHHDELYDIYNLLFDYSSKIQEASLREDKIMIEAMENMVEDIKDGDLSSRIDINSRKEVLTKSKALINSVLDILSSHLSNILDISNNHLNNDFQEVKQDAINKDLAKIYSSMNKVGLKFSNTAHTNVEVAMGLEENHYKIADNIKILKNSFESQILDLDDIINDTIKIYSRMDHNIDLAKDIGSASDDVLEISKKYKDFSSDSIEYINQTNSTHSLVNEYLDEIEYYSNKANILSINTAIQSSQYEQENNVFEYFTQEFKNITSKFTHNIANIKEIISKNIELGKGFYSRYDGINYNLLVKKINQISSFAKNIDSNTQKQFLKLSSLQNTTEQIQDKNKIALRNVYGIDKDINIHQGLANKLIGLFN